MSANECGVALDRLLRYIAFPPINPANCISCTCLLERASWREWRNLIP
jgi:hypothetical protein